MFKLEKRGKVYLQHITITDLIPKTQDMPVWKKLIKLTLLRSSHLPQNIFASKEKAYKINISVTLGVIYQNFILLEFYALY